MTYLTLSSTPDKKEEHFSVEIASRQFLILPLAAYAGVNVLSWGEKIE